MRAKRDLRLAGLLTAVVVAMTGCASAVEPQGVGVHDDVLGYHQSATEQLVNEDLIEGLGLQTNYVAVGYKHGVASDGSTLHVQHTTSYVDGSYLEREANETTGLSIDSYHEAGSDRIYYLFGDEYTEALDIKPWGVLPGADLDLENSPRSVCQLSAPNYACQILRSWNFTSEQLFDDESSERMPNHVQRNGDGSLLLTTAVSLSAMTESNMFTFSGSLAELVTDETLTQLIPAKIWFDRDGVVVKAEVNGTITSPDSDLTLELQIGYEVTGTADPEEVSVAVNSLDDDYTFELTDQAEIDAFWDDIQAVRLGEY
ncbi:hypothetical protein [Agrococcus casei]|uniref:hypothetical protein n=1 Tax=Agrococcus casei TaxID=343512 RepID=UPI0011776ADE|nr:hypothetical protein [Agrococcus casei]